MEQIPKLIYIDDQEWVWCKNEQEYKPASEFEFNQGTRHGYHFHCRECWSEIRRNCDTQESRRRNDRNGADRVLTRLGYDIMSDVPVHEQFLSRHGLV
jgi:hypothetical protein